MKRKLIIVLTLVFTLILVSCGKQNELENQEKNDIDVNIVNESTINQDIQDENNKDVMKNNEVDTNETITETKEDEEESLQKLVEDSLNINESYKADIIINLKVEITPEQLGMTKEEYDEYFNTSDLDEIMALDAIVKTEAIVDNKNNTQLNKSKVYTNIYGEITEQDLQQYAINEITDDGYIKQTVFTLIPGTDIWEKEECIDSADVISLKQLNIIHDLEISDETLTEYIVIGKIYYSDIAGSISSILGDTDMSYSTEIPVTYIIDSATNETKSIKINTSNKELGITLEIIIDIVDFGDYIVDIPDEVINYREDELLKDESNAVTTE